MKNGKNPKDLVVEDKKICVRKLEINTDSKTRVVYSFPVTLEIYSMFKKKLDIQYKIQTNMKCCVNSQTVSQ